MTMHADALLAVLTYREQEQARLDALAATARVANVNVTRDTLRNLVPADDPFRPVSDLLAATLTIGREGDGYPERNVSKEAHVCYAAAVTSLCGRCLPMERAGGLLDVLSTHTGPYCPPSLDLDRIANDAHNADYAAWDAATDYRKAQPRLE